MINERDEQISRLLFKCLIGNLTEEERQQIEAWRQESEAHERLYARLSDVRHVEKELRRRRMMNVQRPLEEMLRRISARKAQRRIVRWRPWVAAASVAALFCIAFATLWTNAPSEKKIAEQPELSSPATIRPGTQQAVLTLADGEKLQLGANAPARVQAMEPHRPVASSVPDIRQLSLEVPRGGEFRIVLEDSTEVWLNSESKLIYPETFSGTERRVAVVGEAYFKVAKDAGRPFYVETDGQQVRVYGTEFNIRSYAEDEQVYTTLIEGSIAISKLAEKSGELMLTPGHQAQFDKREATTFVKEVNTSVVTSWKEGCFVFENQNLGQIMCDLSRWYNFDYRFEEEELGRIEFMGSIPRYSDFSTVLALLKKSGGLCFHIEGTTVTISRD